MEESLDTWFKREILAHEAALVRYLMRNRPKHHEVVDLRQDIYVRVYEAAAKARPAAPKSFLFTTARHLMTDPDPAPADRLDRFGGGFGCAERHS